MVQSRESFGASVSALALVGATILMLTPAAAFTLGAPTLEQSMASSRIERVWWDRWGHWHRSWRPAQPRYHCWRPIHGPRRCQFDYY
jgi:hypothetical protein